MSSDYLNRLFCDSPSFDISPNDIASGAFGSNYPARQTIGSGLVGEKFVSADGRYCGTILAVKLSDLREGLKHELPALLVGRLAPLVSTSPVVLADIAVARCPFPEALLHLPEWNGTVVMIPTTDGDSPVVHTTAMPTKYDALAAIRQMNFCTSDDTLDVMMPHIRVGIHFDRLRVVKPNWGMGAPPPNYVTEVTCAFAPKEAIRSLTPVEVSWMLCAAFEACVLTALLNVWRSTQADVAQLCCPTRAKPYFQSPPQVILTVPKSLLHLDPNDQRAVLEAALRHVVSVLHAHKVHMPIRVMLPTSALVGDIGQLITSVVEGLKPKQTDSVAAISSVAESRIDVERRSAPPASVAVTSVNEIGRYPTASVVQRIPGNADYSRYSAGPDARRLESTSGINERLAPHATPAEITPPTNSCLGSVRMPTAPPNANPATQYDTRPSIGQAPAASYSGPPALSEIGHYLADAHRISGNADYSRYSAGPDARRLESTSGINERLASYATPPTNPYLGSVGMPTAPSVRPVSQYVSRTQDSLPSGSGTSYPLMPSSTFPSLRMSVVNKSIFDISADAVISLYALNTSATSNKLQTAVQNKCGPSLRGELDAAIDAQFQGDAPQEYKVIQTSPLDLRHLWRRLCHILRGRSLNPALFAQKSLMEIITTIKPTSILIDCGGVFGGGPSEIAERTKMMFEAMSSEFQRAPSTAASGVLFLLATNNDSETEEALKRELGIASVSLGADNSPEIPALQRTPSGHYTSSYKVALRLYSQNVLLERKYATKVGKPEARVSAKARQLAMWAHFDNILMPNDPAVESPDIVCLQEIDPEQLPQLSARYGSRYDMRSGGPPEGNELCVILSKRSRLLLAGLPSQGGTSFPDNENTCAVCQEYQCIERPKVRFVVLCFKVQGNETSTRHASELFRRLINSALSTGISRCLICGDLGSVGLPALAIPGLSLKFESALDSIPHTTQELKKPDAVLHSTIGADLVPHSVSTLPTDHRKLISLGGEGGDGPLPTSRDMFFSNHKGIFAAFELW